jgi:single-stranded-DNA-specific exonuclease
LNGSYNFSVLSKGILLSSKRTEKKWEICQDLSATFPGKELGISPLLARILCNRGISTLEEARRFLSPALSDLPSPFLMRDMDRAVSRVIRAIRVHEPIAVFGDYDVDGTTATALLYLFLKGLGAEVRFVIPNRLKEGYGLNIAALKKLHEQKIKLLITADCGISNREEIQWAQEKGIDVVVTDHHEPPQILPPALALLNPKQKECGYPFKGLAGVGVAYHLVIALRAALREEGFFANGTEPNLKEYLDLVALGTVSDVVPLTGVNRILVKYGLAQLTQSIRPGILALKEIADLGSVPVDTSAVNFRLAPRINAAGRLAEAYDAVRLFIATDKAEAIATARNLNQLNSSRQGIEEKILAEAREMIAAAGTGVGHNSFVLASSNWHPGVIGIVASRLIEEYNRPAILIALQDERGKGSGRSIPSFSLFHGLKQCEGWLEGFGGHDQAAGLVIQPGKIADFARAFDDLVRTQLTEQDFVLQLKIDAWTGLDQINEDFLSELEILSPFGAGNPEPVLAVKNITALESRVVGNGHLRLRIKHGNLVRDAIGFRMGSFHPLVGNHMNLAFSPQINLYQGRKTLQLRIVDLQTL